MKPVFWSQAQIINYVSNYTLSFYKSALLDCHAHCMAVIKDTHENWETMHFCRTRDNRWRVRYYAHYFTGE